MSVMVDLTDGETEIFGEPMRFSAGLSEGSKQPAVSTGDDQPAIAVAFTTDDDHADSAWRKADELGQWGSLYQEVPLVVGLLKNACPAAVAWFVVAVDVHAIE
jgi:hypothetical protein